MSGLEVLREIKNIDPKAKVIMVTALEDSQTREKAMQLGADEFITKPFVSDHLEELVRKYISELTQAEVPYGKG